MKQFDKYQILIDFLNDEDTNYGYSPIAFVVAHRPMVEVIKKIESLKFLVDVKSYQYDPYEGVTRYQINIRPYSTDELDMRGAPSVTNIGNNESRENVILQGLIDFVEEYNAWKAGYFEPNDLSKPNNSKYLYGANIIYG